MRRLISCLTISLALAAVSAPGASALSSMKDPPSGANDFTCQPTQDHPNPVVLVHGLAATMGENWSYLSPLLKARGYCVYALTYGLDPRFPENPGGVIPIDKSAPELGVLVDKVLARTGANKVDLVGHSEGTFMPQYWLKFLGGAAKTNRYVAMTPLYGGTTLAAFDQIRDIGAPLGLSGPLIDAVSAVCGSCPQFLRGSPMQRLLVQGGAAAPGVTYTTSITRYDELVVPYTSGILPAPAKNNILQDLCPADISEHAAVAFDLVNAQIVFNALDPPNARPINCNALPPAPTSSSGGGAGAGAGTVVRAVPARLRVHLKSLRLRRLSVRRLPDGATVRLASKPRNDARTNSAACHALSKTVAARNHRVVFRTLFRRCELGPGSTLALTVTAPGFRGKVIRMRVRGDGKLGRRTQITPST